MSHAKLDDLGCVTPGVAGPEPGQELCHEPWQGEHRHRVFGNHSLFYLFRVDLLHRQSESPALGHTLIIICLLYISESHQIPRTILWDTWHSYEMSPHCNSYQLQTLLQSLFVPDSQPRAKQGSTTPVLEFTGQGHGHIHTSDPDICALTFTQHSWCLLNLHTVPSLGFQTVTQEAVVCGDTILCTLDFFSPGKKICPIPHITIFTQNSISLPCS